MYQIQISKIKGFLYLAENYKLYQKDGFIILQK